MQAEDLELLMKDEDQEDRWSFENNPHYSYNSPRTESCRDTDTTQDRESDFLHELKESSRTMQCEAHSNEGQTDIERQYHQPDMFNDIYERHWQKETDRSANEEHKRIIDTARQITERASEGAEHSPHTPVDTPFASKYAKAVHQSIVSPPQVECEDRRSDAGVNTTSIRAATRRLKQQKHNMLPGAMQQAQHINVAAPKRAGAKPQQQTDAETRKGRSAKDSKEYRESIAHNRRAIQSNEELRDMLYHLQAAMQDYVEEPGLRVSLTHHAAKYEDVMFQKRNVIILTQAAREQAPQQQPEQALGKRTPRPHLHSTAAKNTHSSRSPADTDTQDSVAEGETGTTGHDDMSFLDQHTDAYTPSHHQHHGYPSTQETIEFYRTRLTPKETIRKARDSLQEYPDPNALAKKEPCDPHLDLQQHNENIFGTHEPYQRQDHDFRHRPIFDMAQQGPAKKHSLASRYDQRAYAGEIINATIDTDKTLQSWTPKLRQLLKARQLRAPNGDLTNIRALAQQAIDAARPHYGEPPTKETAQAAWKLLMAITLAAPKRLYDDSTKVADVLVLLATTNTIAKDTIALALSELAIPHSQDFEHTMVIHKHDTLHIRQQASDARAAIHNLIYSLAKRIQATKCYQNLLTEVTRQVRDISNYGQPALKQVARAMAARPARATAVLADFGYMVLLNNLRHFLDTTAEDQHRKYIYTWVDPKRRHLCELADIEQAHN
jgi:hypothetical protein